MSPVSAQSPPIIVVSGASGSGKTTLCHEIASAFDFYYSISHTTRPQREQEVDGRDYFFVDLARFQQMIQAGDFLEWARVYDNFYGTSRLILEGKLAKGQGVILDVDTQGAANIKKAVPGAFLVFIDTPDLNELNKRLQDRRTDSSAEIQKRMASAEREIAHKAEYSRVIVNDKLDRALLEFKQIVRELVAGG